MTGVEYCLGHLLIKPGIPQTFVSSTIGIVASLDDAQKFEIALGLWFVADFALNSAVSL
jgi:hypothetical protein